MNTLKIVLVRKKAEPIHFTQPMRVCGEDQHCVCVFHISPRSCGKHCSSTWWRFFSGPPSAAPEAPWRARPHPPLPPSWLVGDKSFIDELKQISFSDQVKTKQLYPSWLCSFIGPSQMGLRLNMVEFNSIYVKVWLLNKCWDERRGCKEWQENFSTTVWTLVNV